MKLQLTIALLFSSALAMCQTLSLDPAFGNAGIAATNLSNNAPHFAYATGKQSNGKMIIGGSSLIRVSPDGNADSSFGINGMAVKSDFPDINTLAVQGDDKIVCVFNNYSEVLIKRFTAGGTIDSSFNSTGISSLSEPGKTIYISKVRLQQDGKILLVGQSFGTKTSFFISRFLPDGTPDVSFNGTGHVTLDISLGDNIAYDIAEQSTGKLIVGGSARVGVVSEPSLTLIRLNSDGSRDMSYNTNAVVQYSNVGETAHILHAYNDDKILVAGTSGGELLLMRFLAEGEADSSFSSDGLHTEAGLGTSLAKQVDVLEDSSIVISGQTSVINPLDWEYAFFKFNKDGEPDISFNGSGFNFFVITGNDNCAGSILINDESILLAGYNDNTVIPTTLKISGNGTIDNTYGTDGKQDLNINGTDETIYTILKQTDNKLISIGNKTNLFAATLGTAIVRYTTGGVIDSSFATNGVLNITEPDFVFHSAIIQPDDKILLIGDKYIGDIGFESGLCVIRINSDGSLDESFGNSGIALAGAGTTAGYGKAIGLLSNGNIMVAGKDPVNSDLIILFRLLSNGTVDNSFATSGKKTIDPGLAENGLGTMTIQPDDKILLGGYLVQNNGQSFFFCMRLESNGDFDAGFATNGTYRTASSTSDFVELNTILLAPGDKVLLTGHVISSTDRTGSVCVIRLLPNGTPDNSFNGNGTRFYYKRLNVDSTFLIPTAAAIHPDSSIYIIGDAFNTVADHGQFIIRIKQNSVLDSTISTEGSGWYYMNHGGLDGTLNDLIVNEDSSIFVAGNRDAIGTNKDFLIAAYKRLPDTLGITYVFNGNGLWTDAANWLEGIVPPSLLPNGATIIVDPISTGNSILNVEQNIAPGGRFIVKPGKKLMVQGNFKIGN